jgi:uncharacterized cysteine cluster protein YcgN (CxxCxxCC family)
LNVINGQTQMALTIRPRFWETVDPDDLTASEWELLCDGCGICCLKKLQDADTGQIYYTDVACRLLDTQTCRCRNYANRKQLAPTCLTMSLDMIATRVWLPDTCAYKRIAAGRALPSWHHLVSGDPDRVHAAGISVQHWVISEEHVHPDDLIERILPNDLYPLHSTEAE